MSTQPASQTETKAQRAERLKREKNPWECLQEIRDFARQGYSAIPEAWIKTYFRWWGVYTQGDGAGGSLSGRSSRLYFLLGSSTGLSVVMEGSG